MAGALQSAPPMTFPIRGRLPAPAFAVLAAAMLGVVPAMADAPPGPAAAPSTTAIPTPYDQAPPSPAPAVDPAASPAADVAPALSAPAAPPPRMFPPPALPPWSDAALPPPRRDPGMIAGGVTLTVLGGGGIFTGIVLLLSSVALGVGGGDKWKGYLGGGVASLGLGGLGLGIGIPLIKSGARKVVRDVPSAQVWLAPGRLTMSF